MPAFLEPVRGFVLRVGREARKYGDPYQASGVVNFNEERQRWEIIAFTRGEGDYSPALAYKSTVDALRERGIAEFWFDRIRKDGSHHWVRVRTDRQGEAANDHENRD